jgi:hypothetical protein
MHTTLTVILYVFAAWFLVGTIGSITNIGKPRQPITPAGAARTVVVGLLVVGLLIWAAVTV